MKDIVSLISKAFTLFVQGIKVIGKLLLITVKKIWKVLILIVIAIVSILTFRKIKHKEKEGNDL